MSEPTMNRNSLIKQARQTGTVLGALIFLAVFSSASAAINFDTAMSPAATLICNSAKGFIASPLLTAAAFVMFIAGGVMIYGKIRGGLGLLISAFVGYVLLKQIVPIAVALKIAPNGC